MCQIQTITWFYWNRGSWGSKGWTDWGGWFWRYAVGHVLADVIYEVDEETVESCKLINQVKVHRIGVCADIRPKGYFQFVASGQGYTDHEHVGLLPDHWGLEENLLDWIFCWVFVADEKQHLRNIATGFEQNRVGFSENVHHVDLRSWTRKIIFKRNWKAQYVNLSENKLLTSGITNYRLATLVCPERRMPSMALSTATESEEDSNCKTTFTSRL